jgi:hypothetical protein
MMDDYRHIPVEVLRDFARTRSEMTSIRSAAEEVGIGRSTFHKFFLGNGPQPRVRRLLGLWCLERWSGTHDIDVARLFVAALAVLLSDLPGHAQEPASARVVDTLRAFTKSRDRSRAGLNCCSTETRPKP